MDLENPAWRAGISRYDRGPQMQIERPRLRARVAAALYADAFVQIARLPSIIVFVLVHGQLPPA